MLRHTFCHIPGVGEKTERRLWEAGLTSWEAVLEREAGQRHPAARRLPVEHLRESVRQHAAGDPAWFAQRLPAAQSWRLFRDFRERCAYLDIETTGMAAYDHVTTIALYDGRTVRHYVHGQNLHDFARDVAAYRLLVTFNGKRFDLRVLYVEFNRASQPLSLEGRAILDPMEIFHTREPRDLTAAVRFYCGRKREAAHAASADALATAEVLDAMLGRYPDLPRTVAGLDQHLKKPNAVDSAGNFIRVEGEIRFSFGKYRGQPLDEIARMQPDYLQWMLTQDFFDDVKAVVRDALRRSRRLAMA
jgi:hypothetical protein